MAIKNMEKFRTLLFGGIAILYSMFQLYTGTIGRMDPFLLRIIHLYFALVLTFLMVPSNKGKLNNVVNDVFLGLVVATGIYLLFMWPTLTERFPLVSPLPLSGFVFGSIFYVVLLEALRRHMGKELVIVVIVLTAYVLFGKYTYGIFKHLGYSIANVLDVVYLSTEGTFGETLGISANYLFLYVLFGSFLVRSGIGELIIDLGKALAGNRIGGAGKITTVASAGFGMISGSAVSSVLTVGSFCAPLLNKMGYTPIYSGALIATASTGGVIMPPVMGAIAFLMAEYLGIPYGRVIIYAFFPACLYYLCLYASAHFEAKKQHLPVLKKEELPSAIETLKKGWYLLIPAFLLVGFLIKQYSAQFSVLVAIYANIALMLLLPNKKIKTKLLDIVLSLKDGARDALMVVIALAVANLIEGLFSITGVALKISAILVQISPNIFVLLGLAAGTLFLLGLALPSFVIYITAVPLLIPPMLKFGLDPVASHLFLLYWAVLSMITPPTGASFYAAAAVVKAPIMKVGWAATRMAAPIYLLTFILALHPALLLRGTSIWETLYYIVPAGLGVISIAAANSGYLLSELRPFERLMLIIAGIFLIYASPLFLFLGMLSLIAVVYTQVIKKKYLSPDLEVTVNDNSKK
ncbi:MAG: TRAP transporter fused permease subunit [Proteobacteria bacterium]|nr:TRAP transporter fused permease subunit [Pseudomonadota bacterium]